MIRVEIIRLQPSQQRGESTSQATVTRCWRSGLLVLREFAGILTSSAETVCRSTTEDAMPVETTFMTTMTALHSVSKVFYMSVIVINVVNRLLFLLYFAVF